MIRTTDISFTIAKTNQQFAKGVALFKQYAASLPFDLSFQNFAQELSIIHQQYNKPKGALLIACNGTEAIGCVGIRELDKDTAELKRMFVKPEWQGYKIGQRMLEQILDTAKHLRYKRVRLDTISTMEKAIRLYQSYGFYVIDPYRFNPHQGTFYMEKVLV